MKKVLLIALFPSLLMAQSPNELGEVIVSDDRISTSISESARNITIINRKQIEALPGQNINEILQLAAGVDIRQRGAWGAQADVSIRGGSFEQTLILVNGIKMNDPQTGHHNLNLGISPSNIERIEIIKGPAAARYGLNSFSGVINIITKPADSDELNVQMAASQSAGNEFINESNSGYLLDVSGSFGVKNTRHQIGVNRAQSTGYRPNTQFIRQQLNYQGKLKTEKLGSFGAMASYLDNSFGASGFYAFPIDSQSVETVRTGFIAADHSLKKGKWTWKTRGYWRNNFDQYTFIKTNPSFFRNRHSTNVVGGETHLSYQYKIGIAAIGLEYRDERIKSSNLGTHERNNMGVFAENRVYLLNENLQIGTGFYLNQSSDYDVQFLPSVDVSYSIFKGLSGFANYASSFRVPSFTDLYYIGPSNIGNNDLQPEQANNIELGMKWLDGPHAAQLSVFNKQSQNLIDWVRDDETMPWQPQNFENALTQGVDFNYEWRNFKREGNWYLSSARVSYVYLDINLVTENENNRLSRYALSHLNHQVSTQLTGNYKDKVSLTISAKYFDRIHYKDYWIIDARLLYKRTRASMFIDISNALNTEYIEAANALMPGRWARAGVNVSINDLSK